MKLKILLLFALFAFGETTANAQLLDTLPWCPPGATWVYGTYYQNTFGYHKFTYVGDTIIDNFTTKILNRERYAYFEDGYKPYKFNVYLRESNDSIFLHLEHIEKWIFLYDFNANNFDTIYNFDTTLNISCTYLDTSIIYYDTISVQLQEKLVIKRTSLALTNEVSQPVWYYATVLPKIGGLERAATYYTGDFNDCEGINFSSSFHFVVNNPLLCYKDDLRGTINFNQPPLAYDCGDVISNINSSTSNNSNKIKIYPNPTNEFINIESESFIQEISILNTLGMVVFSKKMETQEKEANLDISFLSAGNYFIKINDNYLKFIKP